MTDTIALDRHDFAALDLINTLPDHAAKVLARANATKGIVSRRVADNLVMAGKGRYLEDGRITTQPLGEPWEYPAPEGGVIDVPADRAEETGDALVADAKAKADEVRAAQDKVAAEKKTNGRKAKADASPYSTAPVAGRVKRHGKSRRTGTLTQIEDLLHKDAKRKVEGSGRYAVDCLTHGTSAYVPGMTEAKPLQARTDQFCDQCATLVKAGDKHTEATAS